MYEWSIFIPADLSERAIGESETLDQAKKAAEEAAIRLFGITNPGFRVRLYVYDIKEDEIHRRNWGDSNHLLQGQVVPETEWYLEE